jgi:hypothetical protein
MLEHAARQSDLPPLINPASLRRAHAGVGFNDIPAFSPSFPSIERACFLDNDAYVLHLTREKEHPTWPNPLLLQL